MKDVQVDMSPYYDDFNASKAIDFDNRTLPDSCHCCSGTINGPSWWSIDLGNMYLIQTIVLIGRSDRKYNAIHFLYFAKRDGKINN